MTWLGQWSLAVQAGCRVCQDSLICQHEGLIHFVLRRQVRGSLTYADLLHAGRIGVWPAVLHFDAERGVAFSTDAVVAIQRRMWQAVAQAQRIAASWLSAEPVNVLTRAEENVWRSQVEAALIKAVGRLPARLRPVMVAAYGWDGQLGRRGATGGVSREAVRQWHNAALLLLRLPAFSGRKCRIRTAERRTLAAKR
jgi:RNA polymerase sigma factor (sigma-70 family)